MVYNILIGVSVFGIAYLVFKILTNGIAQEIPDHFWGPASEKGKKEDTSVRPFKINIDEKVITDLKRRLKVELTGERLTTPLEGIGFEYGFNTKYLKTIGHYWLDKYDWKLREKLMNRFPHFKTEIDGIDIHFLHVKSSNNEKYKTTKPLILVHGWPGSFIEFGKIIPLLTDPKDSDMNFELVIPSLPGYGFSGSAAHPGLGTPETAKLFLNLMKHLGYDKFYAQGGDWGSFVTTNMATLYPENVMGLHINFCISQHPRAILRRIIASFLPKMFMSAEEAEMYYPFSKVLSLTLRETGYTHLQWSKPDTLGVGLSNSPLGLAAYILEKFATWTNHKDWSKEDGGLHSGKFTMDDLLDNIMIYWVTNTITTTVRYYSEAFSPSSQNMKGVPTFVPTGCYAPKNEIFNMPEFFLRDKYRKIIRYTNGEGGHFTAMEVPELLAADVISLFNLIENDGLPEKKKLVAFI